MFTRGGVKAGETVMMRSAAGGAGSAAIQLAVNAGARVIATIGSDRKIELCRELGAEVVLNYAKVDLVKEVIGVDAGLREGMKAGDQIVKPRGPLSAQKSATRRRCDAAKI